MKTIILVLLFFVFTNLYGYDTSREIYPDFCFGITGGYSWYDLTASAQKSFFFGLMNATADVDLNFSEIMVGGFLDFRNIRIDFSYGHSSSMDLSYNINAITTTYTNDYSFPGFALDEYNLAIKWLFPFSYFRAGIGLSGSIIKMSPFSLSPNISTNQYDSFVYQTFESMQGYIANNYLYSVFFDMYLGFIMPAGKYAGFMVDFDYGIDLFTPGFLNNQAQQSGLTGQVDSLSFFAGKASIMLSFYIVP